MVNYVLERRSAPSSPNQPGTRHDRSFPGFYSPGGRLERHPPNAWKLLIYGAAERHLILQTARRSPDREQDGTATWSLTTLQRVLRQAPGLERISTFTILSTLHGAGMTWQRDRTWCETGTARRLRKAGVVVVTDPDTEAKKS